MNKCPWCGGADRTIKPIRFIGVNCSNDWHDEDATRKIACDNNLKGLVKELFSYLDIVEVSDSGKEFHPIFISSVRVLLTDKMSKCLTKMKELVND